MVENTGVLLDLSLLALPGSTLRLRSVERSANESYFLPAGFRTAVAEAGSEELRRMLAMFVYPISTDSIASTRELVVEPRGLFDYYSIPESDLERWMNERALHAAEQIVAVEFGRADLPPGVVKALARGFIEMVHAMEEGRHASPRRPLGLLYVGHAKTLIGKSLQIVKKLGRIVTTEVSYWGRRAVARVLRHLAVKKKHLASFGADIAILATSESVLAVAVVVLHASVPPFALIIDGGVVIAYFAADGHEWIEAHLRRLGSGRIPPPSPAG